MDLLWLLVAVTFTPIKKEVQIIESFVNKSACLQVQKRTESLIQSGFYQAPDSGGYIGAACVQIKKRK